MNNRIVGYIRVSTEDQAKNGHSLGAQEAAIRQFAKVRGWAVDTFYSDEASGSNTDRPGFQRLLSDIRGIDRIIFFRTDRAFRDLGDELRYRKMFAELGIAVYSVSFPVDTATPEGELQANILGSFAQYERKMISTRTRTALRHKQEKGEYCGGVPYGFRLGPGGKLSADPDQQKTIAKIKRMRRDGASMRAIAGRVGLSVGLVHRLVNTHLKTAKARLANYLR